MSTTTTAAVAQRRSASTPRLAWSPMTRRAEVRRHWPDRLDVRLEEHVPLARWGQEAEGRLVSVYGEVFAGSMGAGRDAELPQFAGPAGSELEVARRYALFRHQFQTRKS